MESDADGCTISFVSWSTDDILTTSRSGWPIALLVVGRLKASNVEFIVALCDAVREELEPLLCGGEKKELIEDKKGILYLVLVGVVRDRSGAGIELFATVTKGHPSACLLKERKASALTNGSSTYSSSRDTRLTLSD